MLNYEDVIELLYNQRIKVEEDMNEYIEHEEYTLEEQRYDEGYTNALLWAGLEIAKMHYKSEREVNHE